MKSGILLVCFVLTLTGLSQAQAQLDSSTRELDHIKKEVRHELVMLPYLGVFDNLAFKVDGYDVTLTGQVTRPLLKSEAEYAVKRIEGVEHIDNQIEVLPVSAFD